MVAIYVLVLAYAIQGAKILFIGSPSINSATIFSITCYECSSYKQLSTPGVTSLAVLWDKSGVTDIAAGFRLHAGDESRLAAA